MYSVMVDSLPGNTKKQGIDKFVAFGVRLVHCWAGINSMWMCIYVRYTYLYICIYAVCCSVLQCVAVCCSALQCVAVCCSALQCVAVCCVYDTNIYKYLQISTYIYVYTFISIHFPLIPSHRAQKINIQVHMLDQSMYQYTYFYICTYVYM